MHAGMSIWEVVGCSNVFVRRPLPPAIQAQFSPTITTTNIEERKATALFPQRNLRETCLEEWAWSKPIPITKALWVGAIRLWTGDYSRFLSQRKNYARDRNGNNICQRVVEDMLGHLFFLCDELSPEIFMFTRTTRWDAVTRRGPQRIWGNS